MTLTFSPRQLGRPTVLVAVLAALGACSGPPTSKGAGMLGYGTPGVSTYQAGPSDTLRQEMDRCSRVSPPGAASQTRGLPAACAQLHRTMNNQPGNAVQATRTP